MPVLVFEWGKESRIVKRQLKTGKKEVSWGLNLAKKKIKIENRLWFFGTLHIGAIIVQKKALG
jgi:hypothetical protein